MYACMYVFKMCSFWERVPSVFSIPYRRGHSRSVEPYARSRGLVRERRRERDGEGEREREAEEAMAYESSLFRSKTY